MPPSTETATRLYVSRQPILDLNDRVFGYELLHREEATDRMGVGNGTSALLDLGLETVTGGRQSFLNLTRSTLVGHIPSLLPQDEIVIEVRDNVTVDDEVIEACRRLHEKGYRLALENFVSGSDAESLLPYASFVKVDVVATPNSVAQSLPKQLAPYGIGLLAEKVDTRAMYHRMCVAGYTLFQGFYFCEPLLHEAVALTTQTLAYLRLLAALNRPELSTVDMERLILKQDVSLSQRVLRSLNSAAYPMRSDVKSIGQALLLFGLEPIRRWASACCLVGLNGNAT